MVHVLGVSMPRSGHHLFVRILRNTLRDRFAYCEFYKNGCCKAIPCTSKVKTTESHVFLQKSHDRDFKDPLSIAGTYRVVQYRSPVPRALSNYELHLKNGSENTPRNFRNFLINEALYSERFYKKWLTNRALKHLLLSYEELANNPLKAILDFLDYIETPIGLSQVTEAVAKSVTISDKGSTPFAYSNVYAHRYASSATLAQFEDLVIRNCPGYHPVRYFPITNSSESLMGLLFGAKKAIAAGDQASAMSFAEAAGKEDAKDPMVKR